MRVNAFCFKPFQVGLLPFWTIPFAFREPFPFWTICPIKPRGDAAWPPLRHVAAEQPQ